MAETETLTRPTHAMQPMGWRNRYFAHGVTPSFFGASELVVPDRLWPTREEAEAKAAEFIAICMADAPEYAKIEYLGAHPVYGSDKADGETTE